MIFNTWKLLATVAVLTAALCSCSADTDNPPTPRGEMSLRISFDAGERTRADIRENRIDPESKIDNVSVLLFTDAGDSNPGILYDCLEAKNLSYRTGGYHFDATISLDDPDIPARLIAVLLCNTDIAEVAPLKRKSFREISDALVETFSADRCAEITMYGQCSPAVDTSLATQQLHASVTRDRARIDVDASAVDTKIFTLSEIYVYRYNDRLAPLPLSGVTPCVPASAVKVPSAKFDATPATNAVMAQVYIPEADLILGGDGNPSDSHRLERTALVVGGRYMESRTMSYYRIDFTDADGNINDIIRNHRYVINITDVKGPGSDTPDIAYSSITAGITATVIDWERSDRFIVFDGAHWLSVESRSLLVGPDTGNSTLLPVASDIPSEEWKLAWADDGDTTLPDNVKTARTLEGKFFRVTCPEGDITDGGNLLFEALSPLPDGIAERSEILHILASGRLHLWIRVTQCDLGSSPWTDGGVVNGSEIFE